MTMLAEGHNRCLKLLLPAENIIELGFHGLHVLSGASVFFARCQN